MADGCRGTYSAGCRVPGAWAAGLARPQVPMQWQAMLPAWQSGPGLL